jgi:hypothetical protein
MSGGDGMDTRTQMHVVRCVWVPMTMSYHARHLMLLPPEVSALAALLGTERPLGLDCRGPRYVPSWITRRIYN